MTAGFYPELFDPAKAVRLYRPVCTNGAAGNVACPNANQASIDPANPGVFLPFQLAGTVVPGSGTLLNGIQTDGRKENGNYYDYPRALFGPRVSRPGTSTGITRRRCAARGECSTTFPAADLEGSSAFRPYPTTSW